MAHKKAGGSTSNGRDSNPKYRGVKRFGGQTVNAGEVIVRQKGMKFRPGTNVYAGKDATLHAQVAGKVEFSQTRKTKFNGKKERVTLVHVAA